MASERRTPLHLIPIPPEEAQTPHDDVRGLRWILIVAIILAIIALSVITGCSAHHVASKSPTFDRATFLRNFTAGWSSIVDTITEEEALAILDSNGDGRASYAEIHVGQVLLRNIVCANLGSPTGNTADDYRQHMTVKLSWDAAEGDQ